MIIEYDVPFFANTADNTHCFQATFRMITKHFRPGQDYSWEELEKITAKVEGLWTWPMAGLMWLADNGYNVVSVSVFDYDRFIRIGNDYLLERFGEEAGQKQIAHSDIEQERRIAQQYVTKATIEHRIPEVTDIERSLCNGYLVLCNVNARALNSKSGYSGHFVVVIGYDEDTLLLHDPGLPGRERRVVTKECFESAWAYPTVRNKGFTAIKLS